MGETIRKWDIWGGEVRLHEDGRVQHLDGDDWLDGWGHWVSPHPRDSDHAAYLEWDAAVTSCRARAGKYSVEVHRPRPDGELVNGLPGWQADVLFLHDGADIGTGHWDGEGFVDCRSLCGSDLYLPMEEDDDEVEIYRALAVQVRAHLASLDPGPAPGLALAL
jgi:hypothetical protein